MRFQPQLKALSPWVAAFGVTGETRIATPLGERAASTLSIGDLITTRDQGAQPITELCEVVSAPAERNHYPVRIAQGAMGQGLPRADLTLGSQHRVLFEHARVSLMFAEDAVLVRAKSLSVSHDRIQVERVSAPVSYIQISTAQQTVIYAEGLPIESVMSDGECEMEFMTLRSWELMAAVA
ncbi:Hint domain-containing protein [Octadecabacter sp.]|nr:Hint domain-containing protein [Octadecabacter sp.]